MATYVELTELRSWLGISSTETGDDSVLEECLTAAQKQIEDYCHGRTFLGSTGTFYYREEDLKLLPVGGQYRAAGSGTNTYSWDSYADSSRGKGGYGHVVLWLGRDLLSVSSLTNGNGTTISSTGYWVEPRNSTSCYSWIRLKTSESWQFNTDGEISVAGTWGFSTTPPADIVQATRQLAAYLYRARDNPLMTGTATIELGVRTVPLGMPADVQAILDRGGYARRIVI